MRGTWLVLIGWALGCGDDGAVAADAGAMADAAVEDGSTPPFAELATQGFTRLLGAAEPSIEGTADGVDTYRFAETDEGPRCLRGDPFRVAVRDQGAADLVIFLQGGGACWSDYCLAIQTAPPGIPGLEVLDPDRATNPVGRWNHVYVPYCDGSLFAGHAVHDDDGDGTPDRIHRGLANLSAALDVARARFPAPRRVLLAGSSGGGYGTIPATVLVRAIYPDAPIFVFNDSGVGIAKPDEPAFTAQLLAEWDAGALIPASCVGCLDDGHLTGLVAWALARDPKLTVGVFSSFGDSVIATLFLRIGAARFEAALRAETGDLVAAFPGRYQRFLVPGTLHTVLLGTVEGIIGELPEDAPDFSRIITLGGMDTTAIDGVTVGAWLEAMVSGSAAWISRVGEAPP